MLLNYELKLERWIQGEKNPPTAPSLLGESIAPRRINKKVDSARAEREVSEQVSHAARSQMRVY